MKNLLVTCSVLLFAACASHPSAEFQSGDAENAIRKADAQFMTAVRAGDAVALSNFYAADGVLMPPNAPAQRGQEAIRTFWSGFIASGSSIDLQLMTDEVQQSGDLAIESGHYIFSMTPKDAGTPVHDEGKFLLAWRKTNGQWKIARDMFNSDLAPAH